MPDAHTFSSYLDAGNISSSIDATPFSSDRSASSSLLASGDSTAAAGTEDEEEQES
jgi:hypothetical protein